MPDTPTLLALTVLNFACCALLWVWISRRIKALRADWREIQRRLKSLDDAAATGFPSRLSVGEQRTPAEPPSKV